MEDPPLQRSQRIRRAPARFDACDDEAEAWGVDSSKAQPSIAKGRKNSQAGRGRPSSARRDRAAANTDSSDSDDVGSESPYEDSSEDGDNDDAPDMQPKKRRAASAGAAPSVFRVLDPAERQDLDKKRRSKKNEGTMKQYSNKHGVWERWLKNGGYTGGPAIEVDLSQPTPELMGTLVRFMTWYAAGRPGDPIKERSGGRKASVEAPKLKGVHSAMQELVKQACNAAGTPHYDLRKQGDYTLIYDSYCTKSASRTECDGSSPIFTSYTRDDHVRACHTLLSSSDANANRDLAMVLYQVSTVARGDDVRPRKLCQMDVRVMDAIGPSQCMALTFQQPGGKTLGGRPAYKSFIRNRLPECCAVRALFAHLAERFALNSEPMPEPGTDEWRKFLLFPGRDDAYKPMSPSNHERIILALFKRIDVVTQKVTHEFRIFPAQAMYEMGVSLEVIQRAGHWVLDPFTTCYIIPGYSPEALLALAFWAGAAQKDFTGFWAGRFHVAVPEELIDLLFPGLRKWEAAIAAKNAAAGSSRAPRATPEDVKVARAVRMGGTVVVQDSLELAEKFPDNRIHRLLLQQPIFRELLRVYKAFKAVDGFGPQRPMSSQERLQRIEESVQQLHLAQARGLSRSNSSSSSSSACRLDWEAYRRMEQEVLDSPTEADVQQHDQQQPSRQQLQPEVLRELAQGLQQAASGRNTLSAGQLLRYQRQQQVAAQRAADSDEVVQQPALGQQQQPVVAGSAAAGAADSRSLHSPERQQQQQQQQQQESGIAGHSDAGQEQQQRQGNAGTAAAGIAVGVQHEQPAGLDAAAQQQQQQARDDRVSPASPRQQVPAFGSAGMLVTPSGRKHSAADIAQRTVASRTPGGHYTTFFSLASGAEAMQQQQRQLEERQQQQVQQQQQQAQQQQRQQQQGVVSMQQLLLRMIEEKEQSLLQQLHEALDQQWTVDEQWEAAYTQLAGSTLSAEQQQGLQEQQVQLQQQRQQLRAKVQQLRNDLDAVKQQKQEAHSYMQCSLQHQAPATGTAAAAAAAAAPSELQEQPAGLTSSAEPNTAGLAAGQRYQPLQQLLLQQQQQQHWPAGHILQQMGRVDPLGSLMHPFTNSLGMPLNTQLPRNGQDAAIPAAGVASMFLQLDNNMRILHSEVVELKAAVGVQQAEAVEPGSDAAAGAGAAPCAGMPPGSWAALGSDAGHAAAAGPAGSAAVAAAAAAPAAKGKKQKPLVRAFPSFGDMGSVKALVKFYFIEPLPESLIALDGVGAVNGDGLPWTPALADEAGLERWRGGRQGPFQRWYEIRFVAAHVKEKVKELSAKAGPGVLATVTEAAAALDSERSEMKLTMNKYYLYLKRSKSKDSSKGNSNSSEEEDEGAQGDDEVDERQ